MNFFSGVNEKYLFGEKHIDSEITLYIAINFTICICL